MYTNYYYWGFHKASAVEKVHTKFCKRILRVKQSTASYFVYGELGRYPLYIARYVRILKFWLKIVNNKANPLVCKVYEQMYNSCEFRSTKNWAHDVKELLQMVGLNCFWINQKVNNPNKFLSTVYQTLIDQYCTTWHRSLSDSVDGRLYMLIKIKPTFSEYLDYICKINCRTSLVHFFVKNIPIPVVSGKWHNRRPYQERLCTVCNTLGDEYHFVLTCNINIELRKKYISVYFWKKPSMFKFIKLLTSQSKKRMCNLAQFLNESLKLINNY